MRVRPGVERHGGRRPGGLSAGTQARPYPGRAAPAGGSPPCIPTGTAGTGPPPAREATASSRAGAEPLPRHGPWSAIRPRWSASYDTVRACPQSHPRAV